MSSFGRMPELRTVGGGGGIGSLFAAGDTHGSAGGGNDDLRATPKRCPGCVEGGGVSRRRSVFA